MITTALLLTLLVVRAVAAATADTGRADRLALLDRLIVPIGVAFALVALMQFVDLWLSNA